MSKKLEYVGYKKLRKGHIHLYCRFCGYKMSNVPREDYDPPSAVIAHIPCEKCSQGSKIDGPDWYLDSNGNQVVGKWNGKKYIFRTVRRDKAEGSVKK